MQLNLTNVSYAYPSASEPVIDRLSITLTEGWTGIVGDNGCGKSTLAHLACRTLQPTEGSIGPDFFSIYCEQDSTRKPSELSDLALDWSREARTIKAALGIEDDWAWRYETLSGGQQKRLQIACALWRRADVLVMDEPTNDLDAATRRTVADALASFRGIGLLISHDKALLDRLATRCLIYETGAFVMRPGNYTQAISQARREHETLIRQKEDARHEKNRLDAETARRRIEADRSKARRSGRLLDKHDSDARERIGRAIVSDKDGIAARDSATMRRRAARAESDLARIAITKRYDARFKDYGETSRAKQVAHLEPRTIRAGDFLLEIPELWIAPRDHIVLSGDNGCGKSLLVQTLMSHLKPEMKAAFIPQTVDARRRAEALGRLAKYDTKTKGAILTIVGSLNTDPERLVEGDDMSPGELKKLMLAEQLIENPCLLVLDEPTNHLDLGSIEALTELLQGFPGAFLLVTHDQSLRAALAEREWHIEAQNGQTKLFTHVRSGAG